MNPIRVLIVDDHPMMREALRAAIQAEPDLEVIGEAANGDQAVQRFLSLQPDVVIMDLLLPGRDGVQATMDILEQSPAAHIMALTSLGDERKVLEALRAGALGYLQKDATRDQILAGVRQVAGGKPYLPADVAAKLVRALHTDGDETSTSDAPESLTPREEKVLALASEGLTNAQIAGRLFLSEATVRAHFHHVNSKLGLHDRSQAVMWYVRHFTGKP